MPTMKEDRDAGIGDVFVNDYVNDYYLGNIVFCLSVRRIPAKFLGIAGNLFAYLGDPANLPI